MVESGAGDRIKVDLLGHGSPVLPHHRVTHHSSPVVLEVGWRFPGEAECGGDAASLVLADPLRMYVPLIHLGREERQVL